MYFYKKYTPTQNFPRNPKIILRKSCDESKDTKNINSKFLYNIFLILVTFSDVLRITALKPFNTSLFEIRSPHQMTILGKSCYFLWFFVEKKRKWYTITVCISLWTHRRVLQGIFWDSRDIIQVTKKIWMKNICSSWWFLFHKNLKFKNVENFENLKKKTKFIFFRFSFFCWDFLKISEFQNVLKQKSPFDIKMSDIRCQKCWKISKGHYSPIEYHPQGWPEHKRHRKWTFHNETKKSWKSGLITLKNKNVRAFWKF